MFTKNTAQKQFVALFIVLISWSCMLLSHHLHDWTFAIYMEAGTSDMHYWIHKNMNAMTQAQTDYKKLNIVVQVHLESSEAWRYVIRNGAIKPATINTLDNDCGKNVVDFMRWAVKNYPAKHYGLIAWGNGFGILDPCHRPTSTDLFPWDVEPDEPLHECVGGVCPIKKIKLYPDTHARDHRHESRTLPRRGFMFTEAKTFINNATMITTLKTIKETILKGKKLDILGTDCCKMAMLEVGYQLKNFVHFLVGSQNCELKDGWNYKDLFSSFNKPMDATAAAQAIVKTYEDYYAQHTIQNTYTIAALDLSHVDQLVTNLNEVVALSKKLFDENKAIFTDLVIKARANSPSMCQASYYLDMAAVYANLVTELNKPEAEVLNAETVAALKIVLMQGQELITKLITAKALGSAVQNMHGMSFYFPRNRIEASYIATPFAQETTWLSFLQEIVTTPTVGA